MLAYADMGMDLSKYTYTDKRGERADKLPRLNRSALAKEMDACVDALSPLLQRVHDFLARSPARATAAAAQI